MYHTLTTVVAGAGFIGPVHMEALKRLGVRVKGALGKDQAESEQARAAMGLEVAYASFEDVLNDEEVDAVHLALPNVLHYPFAKQALLAGKHVMCEKPLAMTSEESQELVELAKSSGLVAGVCYNIRFYPLNLDARHRVEQGELGDFYSVVGSYVQDWLQYDTDYNWRVLADQGGALRAVADIGTHWMDLVTTITGLEVEAVFADLNTVHPIRKRPIGEVETFSGKQKTFQEVEEIPITTEDTGSILFRFKGGAKGALWVSQVTAGRKNCLRYEISGAKSSLYWDSERPNEIRIGHRERPNELMIKDPALVGGPVGQYVNYPGGHNEGFPDTFKQCFRAFYDAILNNTPSDEAVYPTFVQGHHEVVLCEAILKSHAEERWVKTSEI
ncbi:MAG: Gfo/Idh/MocA family oxidoreductase [Bacteroidota bacterium]